ncbi:MAG: hypothetical protein E6G56_11340 [Actinobacteria bacterium]|nr:MAG: hypothetical protein E6G56_11340 [Actinomycetota bacterium]
MNVAREPSVPRPIGSVARASGVAALVVATCWPAAALAGVTGSSAAPSAHPGRPAAVSASRHSHRSHRSRGTAPSTIQRV